MISQFFEDVANSNGITVRVSATFLPEQSQVAAGRWFWAYHIRIENERDDAVTLRTRHWRITDANGRVAIVDGEGVVGEQPRLGPGESYDYVSGCPLETSHGSMEGHYSFELDDGSPVEAAIPCFVLETTAVPR